MDISGEYRLSLSRQDVWDALMDAATLRRCIPGCEDLEQLGPGDYRARVKTKIGPVSATFSSDLRVVNAEPPERYRLEGEGKSGAAGFGKGFADVVLTEDAGGTVLTYSADFQVGGRLAQLGSRLVLAATRKIADDFFDSLTADIDAMAEKTIPARATRPGHHGFVIAIVIFVTIALVAWWLIGSGTAE